MDRKTEKTGELAHSPDMMLLAGAPETVDSPNRSGGGHALPDAQACFVEHGAFVWRTLRHFGVHAEELEDALQEVFLVVHRRAHTYDGRAALQSWLYGIARNVARSTRRKHARHTGDSLPEALVASEEGAAAALERKPRVAQGTRLLAAPNERSREVLVLFDIECLTMAEVAATLDIPVKTAYGRLYKARAEARRAARRLEVISEASHDNAQGGPHD